MIYKKKNKLIEDAIKTQPTDLGKIESILEKPRPWQIKWLNKFNCEIEKDKAARANTWHALHGWVVDVDNMLSATIQHIGPFLILNTGNSLTRQLNRGKRLLFGRS